MNRNTNGTEGEEEGAEILENNKWLKVSGKFSDRFFFKKKEYGQEGTRKLGKGHVVGTCRPRYHLSVIFFVYEWRLTGRFGRLDGRPRRI